ncbi:sigma 54-interacting transcriptional regulator [bacterium]|nr:sigma 54-interacting transcriptional regulator [bacterium]MBU1983430.1 sigma 54-interacting transcriptional regulator [bacterium]
MMILLRTQESDIIRLRNLLAQAGYQVVESIGHPKVAAGAVESIRRILDVSRRDAVEDVPAFQGLVGRSSRMREVFSRLRALADRDDSVLIGGETGVGKTVAARALHLAGQRAPRPFLTLNLTNYSEGMIGIAEGIREEVRRAGNGTILIEYIEELSPSAQLGLSEWLEKSRPLPDGSAAKDLRARLVATTRRDLHSLVSEGRLGQTLAEQFSVAVVQLPALRNRIEDLPLLVEHFRQRLCDQTGRKIERIAEDVLARFAGHNWPGNIRELGQILEQCFFSCTGREITCDCLPERFSRRSRSLSAFSQPDSRRQELIQVLDWAGWNKAKAARRLGISRETLYRRIRRYGLVEPVEHAPSLVPG